MLTADLNTGKAILGRDGIAMCSLYEITRYPAILALAMDGTSLAIWQGEQLPMIDEVASYTLER